jgi:transcriptional regulator with PAS, ATPase and Fis domain
MATNSNLQEMARNGTFRSDLFYRINVFTIEIPPLRGHAEDIPELVALFLQILNRKHKKNVKSVSTACMDLLTSYDWPGNIRQLKNVMERAILLTSDIMDTIHLPQEITQGKSENKPQSSLHAFEERALREALANHNGNKTRAATELGISLRTLYYWLKRYNISSKN